MNDGVDRKASIREIDFFSHFENIAFPAPNIIHSRRTSSPSTFQQVCIELWPSTFSEHVFFVLANLILCYLGPLCVISFCYIIIWRSVAHRNIPGEYLGYKSTRDAINKRRLKVTKMVFVVIITFAVSWLPLYSIFCIVKFWEEILYDDQGQGKPETKAPFRTVFSFSRHIVFISVFFFKFLSSQASRAPDRPAGPMVRLSQLFSLSRSVGRIKAY